MQEMFFEFVAKTNPVGIAVMAVFLTILGVLVIVFPQLLVWSLGIGIILLGVALLATVLIQPRQ